MFVFGLIIIALGAAIYSNTYQVPFIFDDVNVLEDNVDRQTLNRSWRDWFGTRTIPMYSFNLNYYWHKTESAGYHVVNTIIHLTNAIVVSLLVLLLTRRVYGKGHRTLTLGKWQLPIPALLAGLAGLLFVAHPIQTQAVTYTVQRLASMATFFYLLALLTYVLYRTSSSRLMAISWATVSVAAAILAMHSKEISITLPVTIVMVEFVFFAESWRALLRRIPRLLPWLVTLIIIPLYMMGWGQFLNGEWGADDIGSAVALNTLVGATIESHAIDFSRGEYLLTQFTVVRKYLRMLIWPINQNLDHDIKIQSTVLSGSVLWSLAIEGGLVVLAWWLYRKKFRLAPLGIIFFFLALLPESSVFPITDVMFEHRVYLPFFGFTLVVVELWNWLLQRIMGAAGTKQQVMIAILSLVTIGWIVALGVITYNRNKIWQSQLSIWGDAATKSPNKSRPHNNLGLYNFGGGNYDEAVREFTRALEIDAEYPEARNNLGMIYISQGKLDAAEIEINEALRLKPSYAHAKNNLGAIYMGRDNLEEALKAFTEAIEIDDRYAGARDNLGMTLVRLDRLDEATRHFEINIGHFPKFVSSYNNLGVVYYRQERLREARQKFEEALKLQPGHPNATANLQLFTGTGVSGIQILK